MKLLIFTLAMSALLNSTPIFASAISVKETASDIPKTFEKMLKVLGEPEERICHQGKESVRKSALSVMNEALMYYDKDALDVEEKSYTDPKKFKKAYLKGWDSLYQAAALISKTEHPLGISQPEVLKFEVIKPFFERSLDAGTIPVPDFPHEDLEDLDSHYRYDPMKKSILLGAFPISIKKLSPLELALLDAHPYRGSLVGSIVNNIGHDAQHTALTSKVYQQYKLEDPTECDHFRTCLDSVTDVSNHPDSEKPKKDELKVALFYLLHEDVNPLYLGIDREIDEPKPFRNQSQLSVDFNAFSEFTLEFFLIKNKNLSLDGFLGTDLEEKKLVCSQIDNLEADLSRYYSIAMSEYERVLRDNVMKRLELTKFMDNIFSFVTADVLARHLDITHVKKKGDARQRLILADMRQGLIGKLKVKCLGYFPKAEFKELKSTPYSRNQLARRFQQYALYHSEKDGKTHNFALEFNKELLKRINVLRYVRKHILTTPACQKVSEFGIARDKAIQNGSVQ